MRLFLLSFTFLLAMDLHSQSTFYVKTTGSDNNNGTSWSSAFSTIRKALSKAVAGQNIWVAAGVYYPDEGTGATNNSRYNSFELKSGVALYGGFAGNETNLAQRNRTLNQTILSGDIDQEAGAVASYHVVTSNEVNSLARLDGFYIMHGNANGRNNYWGMDDFGGGMYNINSSATIANCIFSSNWAYRGGGIYNESSAVTITDCRFTGNNGNSDGGGIYNSYSNATIVRCDFISNTSNDYHSGTGGGIRNNYSKAYISHCSFVNNNSMLGAGIYNAYSDSVRIQNCLFRGNQANNGGSAVSNFTSKTFILNCTMWGNGGYSLNNLSSALVVVMNSILYGSIYNSASNLSVSYSLVPGGFAGTGNVSGEAKFKNAAGGDLRLDICSPAINAGNNDVVIPNVDLGNRPRVVFNKVDMGAYEMQDMENILYVNDDATGANNGTSWTNAFTRLQDALTKANCSAPTQIWVAGGNYYPDEGNGLSDNDPNASFQTRSGLELYGNFAGNEDSLHKRRMYEYNSSILSGDINKDGLPAGNSYHVIKGMNVDTTAIIDGFTITGGNANQDHVPENWNGGGMYLYGGSPKIFNCRFIENSARYSGGAIYNRTSYPLIVNSIFLQNHAAEGGAIYNYYYGNMQLYNCSFWGNTANSGGAIRNVSTTMKIANSILWGDQSEISNLSSSSQVSYSIIQGGFYQGTQIMNVDPQYISPIDGMLNLFSFSPAIDKGNNAEVKLATDLGGSTRIFNNVVDLGAFEYILSITQGGYDTIVDPILLTCPADFMLTGNDEDCGAIARYEGQYQATASWDDGTVNISYDPPAGSILPPGENTVTVLARGYIFHPGSGFDTVSATCSFKVQVSDLTPPAISTVTVSDTVLYPPNHKMRDVYLNYTVMDNCEVDTIFLQVLSNEEKPVGSAGDWQIVNDHHVKLRAERNGNGTGRVYGIIITAVDIWSNAASSFATVMVPHDNGNVQARMEIAEPVVPGLNVKVLPNPSSGAFNLFIISAPGEWVTIYVMDNLGREVEVRKNVQANAHISLGEQYKAGVYYVQVRQGGEVKTVKLVKL